MRREMDRTISVSSDTAVSWRGVARSVDPGAAVELHRAQTRVDAIDLIADPPCLLFGDAVQTCGVEDRVRRLFGDQPHHPFVGLWQFAFVDVAAIAT